MSKRNKIIKITASDEEYDALQARKTKPRLASWMRDYCLSKEVNSGTLSRIDPLLIRELSRMGNNLNQIAKEINSQVYFLDDETVNRVSAVLEVIFDEMTRLTITNVDQN